MSSRKATLEEMRAYWEARGPTYYTEDVYGRNVIRAFLEKLRPESLIEIGCGHGELFLIYKNVPRVVGIDWSEEMLKRARQRKARHYLPNLTLFKHDICHHSPPGHYDVALTRTVLMHIPEDHVNLAVRHIVKVADAFLIMEYFEDVLGKVLAPHCWLHDYVPLFETAGCHLEDAYSRPDVPQVLYFFVKNQTSTKT